MGSTNDLLDLAQMLRDAADLLAGAADLAGELAGGNPGREPIDDVVIASCPGCSGTGIAMEFEQDGRVKVTDPCPGCDGNGTYPYYYTDPGEPATPPDWPAMDALADRLDALRREVEASWAGEIAQTIEAAEREADEAPDQADRYP
jgi:hypothetical protein